MAYRLRSLAQQFNIAVVTVIHQPSFEIFAQFHNVYILSKAGKCLFSGSPRTLQQHLNNYNYRIFNSNPADVIISIASCVSKEDDEVVDQITIEVESININGADSIKKASEMKRDCLEMTNKLAANWPNNIYARSGEDIQMHGLCSPDDKFKLYSLWVLLKRAWITSIFRQVRLIFIRLALHLVVAVVLAALYNRDIGKAPDCYMSGIDFMNCSCDQEGKLRQESIPNQNVKFQFFSLLFLMFAALMPTVLTFPAEIKVRMNRVEVPHALH